MSLLRNSLLVALLTPAAAAVFIAGAFWYYYGFYGTGYDAPGDVTIAHDQIVIPIAPISEFAEPPEVRSGVLLIDLVHINNFEVDELAPLLTRVAESGYDVEFLGEVESPSPPIPFRIFLLEEGLRRADSLAIFMPQDAYAEEEVALIRNFVDKGGRLLLVGDPGRHHHINSVASEFGLLFQDDFLYNVVEHELNYRNIFLRDFLPDEITEGLGQIALYTSGSIRSGVPLATTDGNTLSSTVESTSPFATIARGDSGVVAIHDFTFFIPPQDVIADNTRLIANIADYLTGTTRSFTLTDFPHFLDGNVELLLGESSLFATGTGVRNLLSGFEISAEVAGIENLLKNTLFLGLYDNAPNVAQYLEVAGIQIGDTVRTPFTPAIPAEGTGLILLHQGRGDRQVLVVLADTEFALFQLVGQLSSGRFRDGLVGDLIGVYSFQ